MKLDVISIFPEYLAALDLSLIGKARRDGLLDLTVTDLREVTTDRHRTVDDTPYGGGAGMVMQPEPWARALEGVLESSDAGQVERPRPVLVVPSPAGRSSDSRPPTSWPDASTWSSRADATRGSTSACSTGRTSASRSGRCPWATTS